jgi:hypothetical protein
MDTPSIAECIHQVMDVLRLAQPVCPHSLSILQLCAPCRGDIQAWDLVSLLIKPVQRVLKYPLLVDKLVESTADSHPDYKAAHKAKDVMSKVAQDINEFKRRKDLG